MGENSCRSCRPDGHKRSALSALYFKIGSMQTIRDTMKPMTEAEKLKFQKDHPGAHFVIGDFEIKCLNPEKYGL